ncbi:hypothetical protein FF38_01115 [Lucilia cuprina]|uniref:Uncharacterized protein n=1 Tax=Lucilia cuprina TaxID=7375 RepID=A0A0L0C070_LUCCU|nr:hypothetical protein FF38_01115 [Lucilia cuprina]
MFLVAVRPRFLFCVSTFSNECYLNYVLLLLFLFVFRDDNVKDDNDDDVVVDDNNDNVIAVWYRVNHTEDPVSNYKSKHIATPLSISIDSESFSELIKTYPFVDSDCWLALAVPGSSGDYQTWIRCMINRGHIIDDIINKLVVIDIYSRYSTRVQEILYKLTHRLKAFSKICFSLAELATKITVSGDDTEFFFCCLPTLPPSTFSDLDGAAKAPAAAAVNDNDADNDDAE